MKKIIPFLVLFLMSAALLFAQDEKSGEGVSVGGNWYAFESQNEMTLAKDVHFEISADEPLRGEKRPYIDIYCRNGHYEWSHLVPNVPIAPPNRPGFYGQPQMEVLVRVNEKHDHHGWNETRDFLSMDKGSTRELLGAKVFKVEFLDWEGGGPRGGGPGGPPGGPYGGPYARPRGAVGEAIASFSPEGVDLGRIRKACDLKPKKP